MIRRLAAALTMSALLITPTAFAQTPSHIPGSGQGGYLGINPGAAAPVTPPPQQLGSMQGGYLGKNPGATMSPPRTPGTVDAASPPTAFCDTASMEPDRCRSRADADHEMCAKQNPDHYMSCRRTLDLFGWRL